MSVLTILFMRVRASEPKTNVKLLQTFIQKEKLFCIITQKTFNMKTSLMGIPDPLPIIALFHDLCKLVSWRDYERCRHMLRCYNQDTKLSHLRWWGLPRIEECCCHQENEEV